MSTDLNNLEVYKRIVEHMSESIWIGDENERTIYANPNFCKIMEYSLDEMIGRESYDFRDPDSRKTVANNNELRKEGEASKYEGVLKSKTGKLIPVLCSGTPIPGGGTVGIMTDLREVKSLIKAEEELKNINKMKDEFIGIVGHELRTPLTAIRGYLSMIIDGDMGDVSELVNKSLKESLNQTKRLVELVNDMLDLSKIESGNMKYYIEKHNLKEILDSVFNIMKILVEEKGILFVKDFQDIENIIVNVDENKFKQVLINLIGNALKFTNEGSISVIAKKIDNKIYIGIKDTGIGIPNDKKELIFSKFVQVDSYMQRKANGLGLGLALSQNIIKEFDSIINIDSKEGEGSTFYFLLDYMY